MSAPLLAAARAALEARAGARAHPAGGPERGQLSPGASCRCRSPAAKAHSGRWPWRCRPGRRKPTRRCCAIWSAPPPLLAGALQGAGAPRRPGAGSALLRLQGLLLQRQPLAQAASALASELASTLGFERVSLGLSARSGLTVLALSHGAQFGPRQSLIQALAAAMQEAIDQGASIAYPPPAEAAPRIVQAHGVLAAQGPGTAAHGAADRCRYAHRGAVLRARGRAARRGAARDRAARLCARPAD
ncbi:MAG: hypothetical protein MZW92_58205 [Comamonadaceae bacterium]|nr:hypothetical protein [Comamonadaceae bacterium]